MRPPEKDEQQAEGTAANASGPAGGENRRSFLGVAGTATMVGGLAAGYGTLGYCALRFLMPSSVRENLGWQLVATVENLRDVDSVNFVAASGAKIVVARQQDGDLAECFAALSSICPHLGCQVHWETANSRFFCPCHNGAFDSSGQPTEGPPADANQSLTQFPLKVENGALYVKAPLKSVTNPGSGSGS